MNIQNHVIKANAHRRGINQVQQQQEQEQQTQPQTQQQNIPQQNVSTDGAGAFSARVFNYMQANGVSKDEAEAAIRQEDAANNESSMQSLDWQAAMNYYLVNNAAQGDVSTYNITSSKPVKIMVNGEVVKVTVTGANAKKAVKISVDDEGRINVESNGATGIKFDTDKDLKINIAKSTAKLNVTTGSGNDLVTVQDGVTIGNINAGAGNDIVVNKGKDNSAAIISGGLGQDIVLNTSKVKEINVGDTNTNVLIPKSPSQPRPVTSGDVIYSSSENVKVQNSFKHSKGAFTYNGVTYKVTDNSGPSYSGSDGLYYDQNLNLYSGIMVFKRTQVEPSVKPRDGHLRNADAYFPHAGYIQNGKLFTGEKDGVTFKDGMVTSVKAGKTVKIDGKKYKVGEDGALILPK